LIDIHFFQKVPSFKKYYQGVTTALSIIFTKGFATSGLVDMN